MPSVLTATTHWRVQDLFNSLGAMYVPQHRLALEFYQQRY
jgi:hypothetical protein